MIVRASVLLPEPFGPMIACTCPLLTTRSIPFRIGFPSTSTWRSVISRSGTLRLLHRWAGRRREDVERHRVERLRDVVLHRHPDVMRRAAGLERAPHDRLALGGADLRLDRTLEGAHDVARGDRVRRTSECVSATRAALALYEAGLTQARDELLEIRFGKLLARRDLVQAHGAAPPMAREVDHE